MRKLLSLCALPVLAAGLAVGQQNPPTTSTNNPQTARVDETRPVEHKTDYGWLGLLGLAGLLGLRRRDHEARVDRTTVPMDRSRDDLRRTG